MTKADEREKQLELLHALWEKILDPKFSGNLKEMVKQFEEMVVALKMIEKELEAERERQKHE